MMGTGRSYSLRNQRSSAFCVEMREERTSYQPGTVSEADDHAGRQWGDRIVYPEP